MHWGPGTGEESRAPASSGQGGFASVFTSACGRGGKGVSLVGPFKYSWRVGTQFLLGLVIRHPPHPIHTHTSLSVEARVRVLEIGTQQVEHSQIKNLTVSFIG